MADTPQPNPVEPSGTPTVRIRTGIVKYFPFLVRQSSVETGALERSLGILGLAWSIAAIFSTDQSAYVIWATPLAVISAGEILLAYSKYLIARAIASFLFFLFWLFVTLLVIVLASTTWTSFRGIVLYLWLAWLAAYDYVQLYSRLAQARRT